MSTAIIGQNPLCDGQVLIEGEVLRALGTYRQLNSSDAEAGGLLLGFRRGPHLHVTACTQPFPADKRTRTSFKRTCAGHAEIAYQRWCASQERMDYLGEWHSHPEATASPSGIDLREWQKLLRDRRDALVFLIVGIDRYWHGIGMQSRIEPLSVRSAGNELLQAAAFAT
jgi:integrative and conjugative element protein (TIGR02256 family)